MITIHLQPGEMDGHQFKITVSRPGHLVPVNLVMDVETTRGVGHDVEVQNVAWATDMMLPLMRDDEVARLWNTAEGILLALRRTPRTKGGPETC